MLNEFIIFGFLDVYVGKSVLYFSIGNSVLKDDSEEKFFVFG